MGSDVEVIRLSELRPMIHFANKMTTTPGQTWGPRVIGDCQFVYSLSGKAILRIGKQTLDLKGGDLVFYGPHSPHQLIAARDDPFTFMSIHFDWCTDRLKPTHPLHRIQSCSEEQLSQPIPSYKIIVNEQEDLVFPNHMAIPKIESLFDQLVTEYRLEKIGYGCITKGLFLQLLTVIIRQKLTGGLWTGEKRKIAPALEAIQKKPNYNWSLMELADLCGYHPTYFSNLFREIIGCAPKHYLITERIKKAKQLLINMELIEEVADQLGYSSVHYFCRNFKLLTGLTPTEYKRQCAEL